LERGVIIKTVKHRLKETLSWRQKRHIFSADLIPSAVLVPILDKRGQYYILLTKRTNRVREHKGQICFPGGTYLEQDGTLLTTALRESTEEIGLRAEDVEILGELDDTLTNSTGYMISPFVAFVRPFQIEVNREEIDEILEIPVTVLLDKGIRQEETAAVDGRPLTVYSYHYQGKVIWGATARILSQLLDVLAGVVKNSSQTREQSST
jgi:8-oxo-dGTP pyrophosphatase MutT (NUDIX family)